MIQERNLTKYRLVYLDKFAHPVPLHLHPKSLYKLESKGHLINAKYFKASFLKKDLGYFKIEFKPVSKAIKHDFVPQKFFKDQDSKDQNHDHKSCHKARYPQI
ncbi:hypothetical protein BpHYR1_007349 [Brachionus plicatilis]|uniref:Uncharacterized protein n=1 Tax=Brachionus plicatilis TaxID=10195 RepID=A0A3M7PCE7_BRAPC|nr:hypothetical protein BpHYR1_007349 [Brachionus plicatilis]